VTGGNPRLRGALSEVSMDRRLPGACHQVPRLPSWGYALPRRVASGAGSASLVPRSLHVLSGIVITRKQPREPVGSFHRTSRYSQPHRPPPTEAGDETPSELRPLQGMTAEHRRVPSATVVAGLERTRCLPRVSTPTAHEGKSVYVATPGLPHPVRSASRVSHPPDGLLRSSPSRLVSSW